jgi:hypothetical protein
VYQSKHSWGNYADWVNCSVWKAPIEANISHWKEWRILFRTKISSNLSERENDVSARRRSPNQCGALYGAT